MTEQQTPDREKMIAEIREALRRVELGTYHITAFANLEYWLRFLLSELDRAEKELEMFDQRGETIERQLNIIEQLQEENRKLRKELDLLQDLAVKVTVEREKERKSAQQEIERLGNLARQERELADHWMRKHHDDVVKLREEREKMIKALKFYANEDNWRSTRFVVGRAEADSGQTAQDVLKKIGVTVE